MTQNHSENKLQGVIRMSIKRAAGDIILLYRLTEEPLPPNPLQHTAMYSLTVTKIDAGGTEKCATFPISPEARRRRNASLISSAEVW